MRRIAMGVVAAAAVAAGCGDENRSLGERDFREQANRICQDGNGRLLELKLPADTGDADGFERRMDATERQLFAALRRLDPPGKHEERFTRALDTGNRADAADGFEAVGLDDCYAFGVTGLPGGPDFAASVEDKCDRAVREMRSDGAEHSGQERVRQVGLELEELGLSLEMDVAPTRAAGLFRNAVADTKQLGKQLARAGEGARVDDERIELLALRFIGAWELLNIDHCGELWEGARGGDGEDGSDVEPA